MTDSIRTYDGATSVVTGGASGIGCTMSEELAKRGSEVIIADLQMDLAKEVVDRIRDRGGKAEAVELDVTDYASFEAVLRNAKERTGRLDYMFNNAGIAIGGPAEFHSIDDLNSVMDVNVRGVMNGTHVAYDIMIKQGYGHIVNTASMAGLMPMPGGISYGASKHAVVGLSRALRIEGAAVGVRVTALCPGFIRTPIIDGLGKYGKVLGGITNEHIREAGEKMKPMDPIVFAIKVLNRVAKNREIIIVPARWRLLWWIDRSCPSMGTFVSQAIFKKVRKRILPDA